MFRDLNIEQAIKFWFSVRDFSKDSSPEYTAQELIRFLKGNKLIT